VTETPEGRLKRLKIRSWRRGTREMDMILGRWSDLHLVGLDAVGLALYEVLLDENDHDLYRWVSGAEPAPARLADLIGRIAAEVPPVAG